MSKITGEIDEFKKYVAEYSNLFGLPHRDDYFKKRDRLKVKPSSVVVDDIPCYVAIKLGEGEGDGEDIYFVFDVFVESQVEITKNQARDVVCHIADRMMFHPNVRASDCTEHSDGVREKDQKFYWVKPRNFYGWTDKHKRYCWDEVPEASKSWQSLIVLRIRLSEDHKSFDLRPAIAPLAKVQNMKRATQFPCCLYDARLDAVDLGDDGLPLVVNRGNIDTWLEYIETPMPENADSLSDLELIAFLAESYKSSREIISYKDALRFSHPRAIETLKELASKDWNLNGVFSHYPPDLRKVVMEFSMGFLGDPVDILRSAIMKRDEEIARKAEEIAREAAEEKARLERERAAEEEAERKRKEASDKIRDFLEAIRAFALNGGYLVEECWHYTEYGFRLADTAEMKRDSEGQPIFCGVPGARVDLKDGYEANVKTIVEWAVRNGASEPEPAIS